MLSSKSFTFEPPYADGYHYMITILVCSELTVVEEAELLASLSSDHCKRLLSIFSDIALVEEENCL